ncbi:SpoIIE family protein phosphatase [Streptomyces sp. CNQ085]|uniref:SpoIIE family protein phosphatase n=1 Tax=Streptomyces sp. CNQ085 TaxID=2886944 RepID=UPI001F504A68|nr:SpoIIE family protein phosphatase [Streptomyces sp. CNQ085]MCI0384562.1 SpoIIE family protein phosphatase [Streptomyces sp. CNQ085]
MSNPPRFPDISGDAHARTGGGDGPTAPHGRVLAESAVESAPAPVVAVDRRGRVSLVNAATRALLPGLAPGVPLDTGVAPGWLVAAAHGGRHGGPEAEAAETAETTAAEEPITTATAHGPLQGRAFTAYATPLPDGHTAWWLSDVTGREDTERSLRSERESTAFLARASARLQASLNPRRCVVATARLAADHLADAAVVVRLSRDRRPEVTRAVSDGRLEEEILSAPPEEMPGLAEALAGFPPVSFRPVAPGQAPAWLLPEGFGPPSSTAVVPLPGSGEVAGAMVLLRRAGGAALGDDTVTRVFAARAGAAISAAALYAEQVATVAVLQRELLPPALPHPEGVELAGSYRPAQSAQSIGGDFYDVHPAGGPGRETDVVLGDVAGKGPEAAVLTGKIRNTLAALRLVESDHVRLLDLLNRALLSGPQNRFVTLVLASFGTPDPATGRITLRLTSAGHPPPLLLRRDGTVEAAPTSGTLVGVLPEASATSCSTTLLPGETCLLYSDGVTEARGGPYGELFGEERLADALASCAGLQAQAVVERVGMLTSEWLAGREHDDIALVAVTAAHRTPLSTVGGTVRSGDDR